MKKILTSILALCVSFVTFADFSFDKGMITFNEDSSFDITITKGWGNSKYDFGYFTYDADGNRVLNTIATDNSGGSYSLGDFGAGDSIGFYYVDQSGNYIYSDEAGHKGGDTMTSLGSSGSGNESFNLGKGNSSSAGIQFTVDSVIKVPTPSGQPLPGVLFTLFLGASALFGGKKLFGRKN